MPHELPTTSWSLVVAAGQKPTASARGALESLCGTYWEPVYAFLRRKGHGPDDARDLTQGFFTKLLEKHYMRDVVRERGRFRSFLLASVEHFVANERDRQRAQKRGSGRAPIPLELADAERRYSLEPTDTVTPERVFERQWALAVLDQAMARLQREYEKAGKAKLFNVMKPLLTGDTPGRYDDLARQLTMRESALRVAVHRLRRSFGQALRVEIAATVADAAKVEDEIRFLWAALSD
jgi:DNA-directed RNA polymerase specialized sigma24 family protein